MSRANSEAMQERWDTNHEYREKQSALLRKIAPLSAKKRHENYLAEGGIERGSLHYREYVRVYKKALRIINKAKRIRAMKEGESHDGA